MNATEWITSSPELLTGCLEETGRSRQFVVVERLPDGGWDWVAWRSNLPERSLYGEAETRTKAIAAAERAAAFLALLYR